MFVAYAHRQPDETPVRYFAGGRDALERAAPVLADAGLLMPVRYGYVLPEDAP
jgi:hypothetical protein